MKQLLDKEGREAEVYKRELSEWFKEQRKMQEQTRMMEEHTAHEKFKVPSRKKRRSPHIDN